MSASGSGGGTARKYQWNPATAARRLDESSSNCSTVGMMSSVHKRSTRSGWSSAVRYATRPPRSWPTTANRSWPSEDITAAMSFAIVRFEYTECTSSSGGVLERP
jgi:hypothetical protein